MNNENIIYDTPATPMDYGQSLDISESQWLQVLQRLNTNFVFLFGRRAAGKSAILSSLLHTGTLGNIMDTGVVFQKNLAHYNLAHNMGDPEIAEVFSNLQIQSNATWDSLCDCFQWNGRTQSSSGFLPARTAAGRPPLLLDGTLTPTANPHAPELNITLLEVAGEVLQDGVSKGNMPSNVDIYFRAQNISKTFLILVPFTDTQQDDALISSWLGNMLARNPMASNCPIILLLTKWDANPRAELQDPSVVVQQTMVQTYNRLQHFPDFRIDAFSIGLIEQMQTQHRDANGQFINGPYTQTKPRPAIGTAAMECPISLLCRGRTVSASTATTKERAL
ncbi:hypothetical protein CO610_09050 [Lysobacteraceae bacterium NML95-0200]|nr:hypothetical protein CO610_09050 [Xanthomonadaceae bacterium NML95-0200]